MGVGVGVGVGVVFCLCLFEPVETGWVVGGVGEVVGLEVC